MARDKGSIRVKYPYVLSKYSIIFKNVGIDMQPGREWGDMRGSWVVPGVCWVVVVIVGV